ncbi:OLC1v1023179C3 [Oldenlandia corymbosa var. corymbosa]|nr:OLC1v1023179C3 [Oldenlandia corymbosa var. corymbosa]
MGSYLIVHQAPSLAVSHENPKLGHRSANYHPTIWGDHFLAYDNSDVVKENNLCEMEPQQPPHEVLKEEVRKMFIAVPDKSSKKLDLIDAINRLGVAYHFESEIDTSLLAIYGDYDEQINHVAGREEELYIVALRFRLLRAHGYHVSCDVFNRFKDSEGNFKESLAGNIRGLLSLYEAANYMVRDEDILDKALVFTTSQLKSMVPNLNSSLTTQINHALDMPIHKTVTRIGARQFMSLYQEDESHDPLLLSFAKLDFGIIQKLHQEELSDLTKWWKGLDTPNEIPFARDRLVECYLWSLAMYFEPKYSFARTTVAKLFALTSILDDFYDIYGTSDQLVVLDNAIHRWDISCLDELPKYMRPCYQALLSVFSEMEKESLKVVGKTKSVDFAISSMQAISRAYHEEASWIHDENLPTYDEYMKLALVTSTYPMIVTCSTVSMWGIVRENALDWVTKNPLILRVSSAIGRLMNDIVSFEAEQERGELASAVQCYMMQYGVSKEEAILELEKEITNAWKDVNQEWLLGSASGVSKIVLERIFNLARITYLTYKKEDWYTNSFSVTKDVIKSVLVDPIEM